MISGTSLSAIRTLLFLGRHGTGVVPPRRIAEELGESPTYLSKVASLLVKAGILHAERGVKGGVRLARLPSEVTLLDIVEACQGTVIGSYCRTECDSSLTCSYHQAALELQQAVVKVLSRWTLAQLLKKPSSKAKIAGGFTCVMLPMIPGSAITMRT